MSTGSLTFPDVPAMLRSLRPSRPVYCIHPGRYAEAAREFLAGFPGRVLYAVKANDDPRVLAILHGAGVTHFDCASLPEIERVHEHCPGAKAYFMIPARLRGAAAAARTRFGVRHFMIDHASGIASLASEIELAGTVVFARMAATHPSAMQELSSKFGAPPDEVPALLEAIAAAGAEPALAFNVGTGVTSPEAYVHAIGLARRVLERAGVRVRLVDVGGGFPKSYPGFPVPPLAEYFAAIREAAAHLPLADDGEIMGEPGRALAAPGLSAVCEVLLRKEDRLYLNDGMYGIFWELRFRGHERYPARAFREARELTGETRPFRLFGPTCDATDVLPGLVDLPADIRPGDHIEFSDIGAYSLAGRTAFNGHYSDDVVIIAP